MNEIYCSNLYTNVSPKPFAVRVHVAHLKKGILEYDVRRKITDLFSSDFKEAYMSIITHGKLYTSFPSVMEKLNDFIDAKTDQTIAITNINDEYSKVIGGLIYRSLDLFLHSRGFIMIDARMEKGKRICYNIEDPFFVLKIKGNIAVFKAIRGLMPKVYANVPEKIYLFFVPDGKHVIEVLDWKAFKGEEVKIRLHYLEELDKKNITYSKVFKLEDISNNDAEIMDAILNNKLKVPLNNIYVPASARILSKFGVLEDLQAFTSFREKIEKEGATKEMTEYKFLEKALEKLLPDKNEFTLRVGLTDLIFRRVSFRREA
ncbi:MAG: hypothetical protein ACPLKQ_05040 [Candidatus Bathyarchaeales archaeon]